MWFRNIFNTKTTGSAQAPAASRTAPRLLTGDALRALDGLALNTDPVLPRQASGARSGSMRRPASEFREHRPYAPGDDVRYVDWKASARQEHIYIKQNADPRAELVYLLVDCSASMTWGEPPKSTAALSLAGLLGYLALANHDRLVVIPASAKGSPGSGRGLTRPLGPLWGKGQAAHLERALRGLRFDGQVNVAHALGELRQRRLSQGGLVLVISDLLGVLDLPGAATPLGAADRSGVTATARAVAPVGSAAAKGAVVPKGAEAPNGALAHALAGLPAPAWKVVICHLLHPHELEPPIRGYYEMRDIETGQKRQIPVTNQVLEQYRSRLQAWREQLAQVCREHHATYTLLPTGGSSAPGMITELQRVRVVRRL